MLPDKRVVWVVDDSPLDAERTRRALTSTYQVEVFSDGSAALEHLGGHPPPDVLVLDWIMPGISGIEVCQFLRAERGGYPGIAILLLTVHQDTEQVVLGLAAGANDYLSKPYADAELQARVGSLIRTRRLLERAERAEADVRAFLASSPDPLLGVDSEGKVTYVSDAAAAAFGEASEALFGRPLNQLIPGFPVDQCRPRQDGSSAGIADVRIRDQLYAPSVRLMGDGGAHQTIIALRNVTESRRAEERRLDFYSVIAHDLRSPLNTVLLRLALMQKGIHGALPEAVSADIRKIEQSMSSQIALINDFLELASLEGSPYARERRVVDVKSLVDETLEELRPVIEASGLTFDASFPMESVEVVGDRRRLMQVLDNLIGNAIKYTPAGGSFSVQIAALGDDVEIAVKDTGPGIPEEAIPTLFERFTRVRHAIKVGGTGLGLMIVREVVEAHGGKVGVDSAPGKGSRFWIRLPRALSSVVDQTPGR
jgi:two-component system phosphate regulon sensor histidine kinase PhoR